MTPITPPFTIPCPPLAILGAPSGSLTMRIRGTEHDGRLVHLQSVSCSIGSATGCTLRLLAPDIEPLHCQILRGRGGTVAKRWSANTWLNGVNFQDTMLLPGDLLTIGSVEFEIVSLADTIESPETVTGEPIDPAAVTMMMGSDPPWRVHDRLEAYPTDNQEEEAPVDNDLPVMLASSPANVPSTPLSVQPSMPLPTLPPIDIERQVPPVNSPAEPMALLAVEAEWRQTQKRLERQAIGLRLQRMRARKWVGQLRQTREQASQLADQLTAQQQQALAVGQELAQMRQLVAVRDREVGQAQSRMDELQLRQQELESQLAAMQLKWKEERDQWSAEEHQLRETLQATTELLAASQQANAEHQQQLQQNAEELAQLRECHQQELSAREREYQQRQSLLEQQEKQIELAETRWTQARQQHEDELRKTATFFQERLRPALQNLREETPVEPLARTARAVEATVIMDDDMGRLPQTEELSEVNAAEEAPVEMPVDDEEAFVPPIRRELMETQEYHPDMLDDYQEEVAESEEAFQVQYESVPESAPVSTASLLANLRQVVGGREAAEEHDLSSTMIMPLGKSEEEPSAPTEQDEDVSIQEYMAQLLQRAGGKSLTVPVSSTPAKPVAPPTPPRPAPPSSDEPSTQRKIARSASAPESPRRTHTPPELKADISAMRELANLSARSAIDRHVKNRWGYAALGKLTVSVSALVTGIGLLYLSPLSNTLASWGSGIAFLIAAFWGIQAGKLYRLVLVSRMRSQDNANSANADEEDDL